MSSILTRSQLDPLSSSIPKRSTFSLSGLRLQLLGLSSEEATFAKRGFQTTESPKQQYLEQIGKTFLAGYHRAIATPNPKIFVPQLEAIAPELKGFAYEGAAMGLALIDALTPWNGQRVQRFLTGEGNTHIYMGYIGLGWALARLPGGIKRYIHKLETLQRGFPDPLLGWLALDGYGFHQGYFYWQDQRHGLARPKSLSGEAGRVFDQGLGRSLWFIKGAEPQRIAQTIQHFQPSRQADLWSGVGLACTYAGGIEEKSILELKALGRQYLPQIAQGAAFAAKTRLRATNLTVQTEQACQILCGVDARTAAELTDQALEGLSDRDPMPIYEQWRQRIQSNFSSGEND